MKLPPCPFIARMSAEMTVTDTTCIESLKRMRISEEEVEGGDGCDMGNNIRAAVIRPYSSEDRLLGFNVGGRVFQILLSTLHTVYPDCLLVTAWSRDPVRDDDEEVFLWDENGNLFLDLDPDCFRILLDWIRELRSFEGNDHAAISEEMLPCWTCTLKYLQIKNEPEVTGESYGAEVRKRMRGSWGARDRVRDKILKVKPLSFMLCVICIYLSIDVS